MNMNIHLWKSIIYKPIFNLEINMYQIEHSYNQSKIVYTDEFVDNKMESIYFYLVVSNFANLSLQKTKPSEIE